jgi:Ca-activated chloride channel family protein
MNSFTFEYPYVFLLLPLFLLCARYCKPRSEAILFPHIEIFQSSGVGSSWLLNTLKWISIISALIALASPIKEDATIKKKQDGYSISLVLDASGSMKFGFKRQPFFMQVKSGESKFDISMALAKEFVKSRVDDEIGLLVFGNFAYVAAPLTYDKKVLSEIMDGLYIGVAGSNYTVINDALFQSAKLFSSSKAKTKIAILLTDGQSRGDNVPYPVAMKMMKKYGVKVYTIGIGQRGDFDEGFLTKIAKESGGEFFAAYSKEDLKSVYEKINQLEKSEIDSQKYVKKSYFYELPLFIAFMALLFYAFILNKRATV